VVETEIDNGQKYRNRFQGDVARYIDLLCGTRMISAKSRAHNFADKVLEKGFKCYGHVVSTYYPPHRIKEINIYEQEEEEEEEE
jgi:hypothetical protein